MSSLDAVTMGGLAGGLVSVLVGWCYSALRRWKIEDNGSEEYAVGFRAAQKEAAARIDRMHIFHKRAQP